MDLAVNTDFRVSTGCPEPHLRAISEAGFSHVHWCHQWCTDFLYGRAEVSRIGDWFREFGLSLLDLHASHGSEKCWMSPVEYSRLAGLELVINRLEMTARLGGYASVLHIPAEPSEAPDRAAFRDRLRRGIDALLPTIRATGVVLAFENMIEDNCRLIGEILREYDPAEVGFCYDSGHGNIGANEGPSSLEALGGRLQAVHLHDNDGRGDLHMPPYAGTVDWDRLAGILAGTAYTRCLSFEVVFRPPEGSDGDPGAFLAGVRAAGERLSRAVAVRRGS